MWSDLLVAAELLFVATGAFFMLVAAIGMLRLSDFYQRLHAPTKASTLGLVFLLAAAALALRTEAVATKAILAILFIAATAPVGAHILSRAAYRNRIPFARPIRVDEYEAANARPPGEPSSRVPEESREED